MFETETNSSCSALSISACEAIATDYKDYWAIDGLWSPTAPEEPILGCTDPEANNYDPEATEDDDSCTYDEPVNFAFSLHEQFLYLNASSTCEQIATTTFMCNATSTFPNYPGYGDWLMMNIITLFMLSFIPISSVISLFRRR